MSEDMDVSKDSFKVADLQDRLRTFCTEQGLESPRFWILSPDGCYVCHVVSLHLSGKDRWEEFEATVLFELRDFSMRENRELETNRFRGIFEEVGEPIVLTSKVVESSYGQLRFFKELGMIKMPITWSDSNNEEYEVYVKGQLDMGGFVNLMERIEYIGKEYVYR